MKFKLKSMISKPGLGLVNNEDYVGSSTNACWIIDGATKITKPNVIGLNEVIWFVTQVSSHLEQSIHQEDLSISSILADILSIIETEYKTTFQTETIDEEMIAASILIVRYVNQQLELFSLGDCATYIQTQDQGITFQNQAIKQLEEVKIEKIFSQRQNYSSLPFSEFRQQIIIPELKKIKRKNKDNQVFSAIKINPQSVFGGLTCTIPISSSTQILLASDGFSRMIDTYYIFTNYQVFLEYLEVKNVEGLLHLLRETEKLDPEAIKFSRLKISDDASLILATIS